MFMSLSSKLCRKHIKYCVKAKMIMQLFIIVHMRWLGDVKCEDYFCIGILSLKCVQDINHKYCTFPKTGSLMTFDTLKHYFVNYFVAKELRQIMLYYCKKNINITNLWCHCCLYLKYITQPDGSTVTSGDIIIIGKYSISSRQLYRKFNHLWLEPPTPQGPKS